ncbi:DUF3696 domain-containing protein [Cupriavidus taiwanensis]|uniref:DUF3696 domain-containing protein n=1 Tax=Cupriavidus taiwanensis TaxID=164546 RepID=A0A7Z7NN71_9BURK|nr:DUF3696 domain-containing protein [Cupriavidus taiwanensis]SOZ09533.1 conserved protein of unknown function [Cupriavidus taiwanensis]SOZ11656.1 conserved protein of unknown function [Cupriavidus taiwanensis]SOZ43010.1 conserved protein of unknown function [Cupriavidus taiwanensis]SPC22257.1 conserved protein of unknown function [Cupriavidus taiwanensis]SPD53759.1 conserved protein of unknown function [Cupriavidus taiwanensis]
MINNILLKNFKSISTPAPVNLTQLSILCGSNSSGKSSLIQAILMVTQTFSSRYDFDSLVLNGHLVRLGSFADIKSHNVKDNEIEVGFTLSPSSIRLPDGRITSIDFRCVFGRRIGGHLKADDDYHPAVLKLDVTITRQTNDGDVIERLNLSRKPQRPDNLSADEDPILTAYAVDYISTVEMERIKRDYPDPEILGCESNGFFPTTLIVRFNNAKRMAAQVISVIAGKNPRRFVGARSWGHLDEVDVRIPQSFFLCLKNLITQERAEMRNPFKLSDELVTVLKGVAKAQNLSVDEVWNRMVDETLALSPHVIDEHLLRPEGTSVSEWLAFLNNLDEKQRKSVTEFIDKRRSELEAAWYEGMPADQRITKCALQSFTHIGSNLISYFGRSVKYLGPLRHEPQSVYASLGHTDPRSVGLKGEFAAAVLHINKYQYIAYPSPSLSEDHQFSCIEKKASLQQACKEWLSYLGVITDYRTTDKGKLGYEIEVKIDNHGGWQDLTHVGVGVSQILPIVVLLLLSEIGDTIILEQPELHLHPLVQSRLCDLLCAMAEGNRQCIVETHSEYMINRLRLRIAQSRDSATERRSSIFFITKKDNRSVFEEVKINQYGAIKEWPKDFFDQSDSEIERILIEGNRKKKSERQNNKTPENNNVNGGSEL